MPKNKLHAAQNDFTDRGKLQVNVTSTLGFFPVTDAKVTITLSGEPDTVIEELDTNISGQTVEVELPAPPLDYSLEPGDVQPYADYDVAVTAPGYETVLVEGVQVLPEVESVQPVSMVPQEVETAPEEDQAPAGRNGSPAAERMQEHAEGQGAESLSGDRTVETMSEQRVEDGAVTDRRQSRKQAAGKEKRKPHRRSGHDGERKEDTSVSKETGGDRA